jgi:hypothetical protein
MRASSTTKLIFCSSGISSSCFVFGGWDQIIQPAANVENNFLVVIFVFDAADDVTDVIPKVRI